MKVEYKEGKMIVKHSSGHIDTYEKSDCEKWLTSAQLRVTEAEVSVTEIEDIIKAIDESVNPQPTIN